MMIRMIWTGGIFMATKLRYFLFAMFWLPVFAIAEDEAKPQTAFEKAVTGIPGEVIKEKSLLTPEQLIEYRKLKAEINKAAAKRITPQPEPQSRSIRVSLSPGEPPETIYLDIDSITSLVFSDSSGYPWPIADFGVGAVSKLQLPEKESVVSKKMNILTISPSTEFVLTNLAVLLEGASAPLVMKISSGNAKKVDFRVDLIVQGKSPSNTNKAEIIEFSPLSSEMQDALDGIPSKDAIRLKVIGDESTQAWKSGDTFFIRTRMIVVSPAAIRAAKSVDGTHVFQIPVSPVVIAMMDGKFVTLKLEGF